MVSKLLIWLVSRLVARRKQQRTLASPHPAAAARTGQRQKKPPLGLRLCGDLERLERWGSVAPNTLVLAFRPDHPAELLFAGHRLKPALLPWREPVSLVVVNTAPTHLDVTVSRLRSGDGVAVDDVVVRVEVQVAANESYAALTELVADHGPAIEAHLLKRVRVEVTSEIQALVSGLPFAELTGEGFRSLLATRWQPRSFAAGSLLRLSFTVGELTGAEQGESKQGKSEQGKSEQGKSEQAKTGAAPADASPAPAVKWPAPLEITPRMELTVDATLKRLWLRHCETPVAGIAAARAGDAVTVVAVPKIPLGAWERTQVKEVLTAHFTGDTLRMLLLDGSSYQALVQSWFRQVDHDELRLLSVQSLDGDTVLRVVIEDESGRHHAPLVGNVADRDALRTLVPHTQIKIDHPDRVAASGRSG